MNRKTLTWKLYVMEGGVSGIIVLCSCCCTVVSSCGRIVCLCWNCVLYWCHMSLLWL